MTNYTERDNQFYPTLKSLLKKVAASVDWMKISSVLEPSAGKGDIADYVREKLNTPYTRYDTQIDCIEKDPGLRKILEGKEYHVIHDDFLTYYGKYHYDLVILNPPFSEGDKHLEKALELQKYGGKIICILNAETIENPYDKTVLLFIVDVLAAVPKKESEDIIYTFFHSGYCYYFAVMLKEAFQRGQVCWCAPYGHMCWLDDNGVAYDIGGICDSECEFYIPVSYINEGLSDFLHIPGKAFNASKEYISQAIEKYKTDLLKSVHVTKI